MVDARKVSVGWFAAVGILHPFGWIAFSIKFWDEFKISTRILTFSVIGWLIVAFALYFLDAAGIALFA